MTFQSPGWLWALLALVPLAAGLALWPRTRAGAARAWARPGTLALPPPAGGPLRWAAAALALAAVAAGIVALARPAVAATGERSRGTLVIAFDISNSMRYRDVAPSRLEAAADAARTLIAEAPEGTAVGIVTFADIARVRLAPTDDLELARRTLEAVTREPTREGTTLGEAVVASLGALRAAGALDPPPASAAGSAARILLITDGSDSIRRALGPEAAARRAAADRVPVDAVMLGDTPGFPDRPPPAETLALMASITGGVFLRGTTREELLAVFEGLEEVAVPVEELRELTVWAAGLGLLLLAGAAALAGLARPRAGAPVSRAAQR